ncbi:MAG: chemotaxis-specific protein-glutamate methyltransferase CheB [Planctomycetota bacterium]
MRIAIVNDLAVACEALRRAVAQDPSMSVAWVAHDGAQAVECARRDRPDLILMDLIMPRMDGVEATRQIMRATPCPILVVTATVSGNASLVYDALGAGALDAVNTPTFGPGAVVQGGEELLRRIRLVAKVERAQPASAGPAHAARAAEATPPRGGIAFAPPIVAIGASTGGPRAVADVLLGMGAPLAAAVLVVQHVSKAFVQGYAEWLAAETRARVALARDGQALNAGDVLVAGEERHMTLGVDARVHYADEPRAHLHRPSVDELFLSLARCARPGVAVLLTGMGRDGADGLLALRRAGWHTIVQDEATSVVWGMPGAAQRLGAATDTLPLDRIGPAVTAHLRSGARPTSAPRATASE